MAMPVSRRLDFTEIPVIDLCELVTGNDDPVTIDALRAACRDVGFVYIRNHGVAEGLIDDVLAASREFFARPMDEKKAVQVDERMRGYLPLRYRSYEGEDNAAQSNQEGYWMGPDRPLNPQNRLDGPNVWPENGEAL
ncbi:MAG: 2-oxoglutarate and iron-dependent oxygenase domain-containing protein, partial [Acidimicrobiaceae bacterium]|nr:2-oxoglutarate and iron-dependent oxygenase domain-containing protein [Acidimicrobiaceae bacterium]